MIRRALAALSVALPFACNAAYSFDDPDAAVSGRCRADADCAGFTDRHRCDVYSGECVECVRDTQCASPTSGHHGCDPASERRVECIDSSDCAAAGQVCEPTRHECVAF